MECKTTPDEIGAILAKIALADHGFLILMLTAAAKASSTLSAEERRKLEEWGTNIHKPKAQKATNDRCH